MYTLTEVIKLAFEVPPSENWTFWISGWFQAWKLQVSGKVVKFSLKCGKKWESENAALEDDRAITRLVHPSHQKLQNLDRRLIMRIINRN